MATIFQPLSPALMANSVDAESRSGGGKRRRRKRRNKRRNKRRRNRSRSNS